MLALEQLEERLLLRRVRAQARASDQPTKRARISVGREPPIGCASSSRRAPSATAPRSSGSATTRPTSSGGGGELGATSSTRGPTPCTRRSPSAVSTKPFARRAPAARTRAATSSAREPAARSASTSLAKLSWACACARGPRAARAPQLAGAGGNSTSGDTSRVSGAQDRGVGLDRAQPRLERGQRRLGHEIDLVQQQQVRRRDLVLERLVEVARRPRAAPRSPPPPSRPRRSSAPAARARSGAARRRAARRRRSRSRPGRGRLARAAARASRPARPRAGSRRSRRRARRRSRRCRRAARGRCRARRTRSRRSPAAARAPARRAADGARASSCPSRESPRRGARECAGLCVGGAAKAGEDAREVRARWLAARVASPRMDELFQAVRRDAESAVWSRGVELVRRGAVSQESSSADEIVLRVLVREGRAAPVVRLFPREPGWECDCDGPDDPCEHVAAAAIALAARGRVGRRAAERRRDRAQARLPAHAPAGRARAGADLVRDGAETPLAQSLAAYAAGRGSGPAPLVSAADLAVERGIDTRRTGPCRARRCSGSLAGADRLRGRAARRRADRDLARAGAAGRRRRGPRRRLRRAARARRGARRAFANGVALCARRAAADRRPAACRCASATSSRAGATSRPTPRRGSCRS